MYLPPTSHSRNELQHVRDKRVTTNSLITFWAPHTSFKMVVTPLPMLASVMVLVALCVCTCCLEPAVAAASCVDAVDELAQDPQSLLVTLASLGGIPTGLLGGNKWSFGDYDGCRSVQSPQMQCELPCDGCGSVDVRSWGSEEATGPLHSAGMLITYYTRKLMYRSTMTTDPPTLSSLI